MAADSVDAVQLERIASRSSARRGSLPDPEADPLSHLPAQDTSAAAWTYLAAAFVLEATVFGFPTCYGVFLEAYLASPIAQQPGAKTLLPLTGTLSGLMYLVGMLVIAACNRFPRQRRNLMLVGAVICPSALIAASFATKPIHLLLTQGILYSLGGAIAYYVSLSYLFECVRQPTRKIASCLPRRWFQTRIGLANGILFSGTSVGGITWPFILQKLLDRYSIPTVLRCLGVAVAIFIFAALPFVKGRLPESASPPPRLGYSKSALTNAYVWAFVSITILQAATAVVPQLWLPTYARSINLSASQGSALVTAVNGTALIARIGTGWLADRLSVHLLAFTSLLATSGAVLILWGALGDSLGWLLAFALIYGLCVLLSLG